MYFVFEAIPKGAVFEVAFKGREEIPADFSREPAPGNTVAVKLNGTLDRPGDADTSWTVEGRIPWSAFKASGGRPEPGAVWSFAICRYDYGPQGTEPVLMSSAPLSQAKFHLYEDYGKLKFVGPK